MQHQNKHSKYDLLSKEHYCCYKIHTLMKSSRVLTQPFYRPPPNGLTLPIFLKQS